jgi:hypothetical protein
MLSRPHLSILGLLLILESHSHTGNWLQGQIFESHGSTRNPAGSTQGENNYGMTCSDQRALARVKIGIRPFTTTVDGHKAVLIAWIKESPPL